MAEGRRRFWLTRRALIGGAAIAGAAAWAGTTAARLSRGPSGPKDAGRIADFDGVTLARDTPGAGDYPAELPWAARGGTINDVSALSRTPVYGVVAIGMALVVGWVAGAVARRF